MSFIEQEASYRYEVIDGKPVKIITPQSEVTLTNMKTGKEYNLNAVNTPSGLAGVEDEHWLRLVTELTMTKDREKLSHTREEAYRIIGEQ